MTSGDLGLVVEVELAAGGEYVAGVPVEEPGFGAGAGEQQGGACSAGGVPVTKHDRVEVVWRVSDDDTTVFEVRSERCRDVTIAQLVERRLFPFVLLSPVDRQFDNTVAEGVECGAERTTRRDLWELMVIADQYDLASDGGRLVDDGGEVACASHRGFVDDDECGRRDGPLLDEVASDRGRVDTGAVGPRAPTRRHPIRRLRRRTGVCRGRGSYLCLRGRPSLLPDRPRW